MVDDPGTLPHPSSNITAQIRGIADSLQWIEVATDSGVVHAAIARPEGPGPFPALIILHGTHGFADEYIQLARDIARGGMLGVAACWFAGGSGSGSRFVTPIRCHGAPPFVDSPGLERFRLARLTIDALVRKVRTLPDVQENRVALFGHSRGGGAALDYILLRTGMIRAAVLNSTGYPLELAKRAPEVDVPILIMHGTADNPADGGSPVTNIEMARRFEAALRNAGKYVEAKYYDGRGHNDIFNSVQQYKDVVQSMSVFLLRVLAK